MEELLRSGHLKNDSFTIGCHVITATDIDDESVVPVPPPDMRRHLGELLSTEQGAGVELLVGGESFASSPPTAACSPQGSPVFKSKLPTTKKHITIQIDGIEPRVFRAILTFIYTDALPKMTTTAATGDGEEAATMAHHLLVAAEEYGLPRPKPICEDKLCGHVSTRSVLSILAIAERHGCVCLKQKCMKFLGSSRDRLRAAMETDGLEYLARRCPGVIKELVFMVAEADLEKQMVEMHVN